MAGDMGTFLATAKSLASEYLYSGDKDIWIQHVKAFHYFPVLCTLMSVIQTPAGKTSIVGGFMGLLNLPGKLAWISMELASPASFLLALSHNVPASQIIPTIAALPWTHIVLSLCYLTHYTHRAIISPLRAPNISPNHLSVWLVGILFNYFNGYSLGGWFLLQFGHVDTSSPYWKIRFWGGVALWALGLYGNIWHENVLYAIRRRGMKLKERAAKEKKDDDKKRVLNGGTEGRLSVVAENGQVYEVPEGGLYKYSWHPHYFVEWIEWTGFLIATGGCAPAMNFLVNEVACMAPRALQGKYWYKEKFGKKTPDRAAVVPFVL